MPHEIFGSLNGPFPSQIRVRSWQRHWHRNFQPYCC